ncbi:MAG: hypothetical protein CTY29_12725 [Methylobacter sp.]|nr:MAG: hypothetical protein CTY29_12725 [Methylobacter sp.]
MLAGILGIPIAMVFGIVPAGISGLVYWVISRDLKLKNPRAAKRFLVGSTTSLSTSTILFVAFYLYNYFHYGSDESFSYGWWFFAWPSCISGGICGVFIKDDSSA